METDLVCPECGHDTFTQKRIALVEYSVRFDERAGEYDIGEECLDGGERDEYPFVCVDCHAEYEYPEDDLISEDAYNAEQD